MPGMCIAGYIQPVQLLSEFYSEKFKLYFYAFSKTNGFSEMSMTKLKRDGEL